MKQAIEKMMSVAALIVASSSAALATGKPLKIYILAGQSNMEGHAKIGPQFMFGIQAAKGYDGSILLIKTAWEDQSLNADFRQSG